MDKIQFRMDVTCVTLGWGRGVARRNVARPLLRYKQKDGRLAGGWGAWHNIYGSFSSVHRLHLNARFVLVGTKLRVGILLCYR